VSFDGFKALNDLNLVVDAGELRCVIGPNGAGKTTMMDVITGKTRPDVGTAFFGQSIDLTRLSEPEIADRGIGRKFQKPTCSPTTPCSRTSSSRARPTSACGPR
jgi:urea transport system ATP-binding protein